MSLKTLLGLVGLFFAPTAASPEHKRGYRQDCLNLCRAVEGKLPGKVFYPGTAGYQNSQEHYYTTQEREIVPGCVVRPSSTSDVSAFVRLVKDAKLPAGQHPFAVRSGGHTLWPGAANLQDGITLDMRGFNSFSLSADKKVASIGGGSDFADIYPKLAPHNLTVLGGRVPGVSAGGFLTGGGKNFLARRYGFACDNIFGYEVVLASGQVTYASASQNRDLWLALKGGSNNFGIITRFDLAARPQDGMWGGNRMFLSTPENLRAHAQAWHDHMRVDNFDDLADAGLILGFFDGAFVIQDTISYSAPVANPPAFANITALPNAVGETLKFMSVPELVEFTGNILPDQAGRAFELVYDFHNAPPSTYLEMFNTFEQGIGAIRNISGLKVQYLLQPSPVTNGTNSLGYPANQKDIVMSMIGASWDNKSDDAAAYRAIRSIVSQHQRLVQQQGLYIPFKYLNYADVSQNPIASYGRETVERLWAASRKYDPKGLFQTVPGYKLPK
ncbi:hypothetical protein QBC42DRAFT_320204 [Cladorrhinum samala]|uniref:FAD-binding PCMH-type domain-containing protein n=1 Tax=Cladorrhinum samala TaxID=585594 RepID=A0AAV9H7L6_9PEZI|nr:hypothetical protein QBC42DRAFT_320204 [Cladorrhinum samala]